MNELRPLNDVLINKHYNISNKTFNMYIYKVLKRVHPELGISKRSMYIMNSFVNDILHRIANEARNLTVFYSNSEVLTAREIQTAVSLILTGELRKHAIKEGIKAYNKYYDMMEKEKENEKEKEKGKKEKKTKKKSKKKEKEINNEKDKQQIE